MSGWFGPDSPPPLPRNVRRIVQREMNQPAEELATSAGRRQAIYDLLRMVHHTKLYLPVSEIAKELGMTRTRVSADLRVLRDEEGLVFAQAGSQKRTWWRSIDGRMRSVRGV